MFMAGVNDLSQKEHTISRGFCKPSTLHNLYKMQTAFVSTPSCVSRWQVATPARVPRAAARCHSFKPSTGSPPRSATSALSNDSTSSTAIASKRQVLLAGAAGVALVLPGWQLQPAQAQSLDDDFTVLPSGLKVLDVRPGQGQTPQPGDTVIVHWSGYTKGYQGKRIDNTSVRDEPYEFVLGGGQAIKAFEDAVSGMQVGGIRRVEVPGDHPDLAYPRDRSKRFTNELIRREGEGKIYKYRYGPQPVELGGQRALDFVLDNPTLQDFNRTLLFDIKLLTVRRKGV